MVRSKKNINEGKDMKEADGLSERRLPNRIEQKEAADYIGSISANLQDIADSAELPFLSYLISLVVEEAREMDELNTRKPAVKPQQKA